MTIPILGPGTSQLGRSLPALQKGYFNVDEMTPEILLALAADYAKMLTFYGLDNKPEGDWELFFSADEAVIIAQILTTNIGQVVTEFSQWLGRSIPLFRSAADLSLSDLSQMPNYDLAKRLDGWLNQLQFNQLRGTESAENKDLSNKIAGAIEGKLRDELRSLTVFWEQFNLNAEAEFRNELSGSWFAAGDAGNIGTSVPPPSDNNDGRDRIERFLTLNFYSFYHSIALLQTAASSLMPASLVNGSHSPATALYIAFIKLFEKAQKKVNRFTERHLDFYYSDVLQAQPQKLVPDSTYLIFSPDVEDRKVLVRKGKEFLAGTDEDNQDVIYAADNELLVHGAQVRELRTLYFERDPRKSPENKLGFASEAKSSQIPVLPINISPEGLSSKGQESRAWPLFGATQNNADDDHSVDANIGFALASPILYLSHGERSVTFQFKIKYLAYIPFRVTDITDSASLISKLRDGSDLLSSHLREGFSPLTQDLLNEFDGTIPSLDLQQAMVDELNQASQRELIYDAQRFEHVQLTPETLELVQQRPQGHTLGRANRLLLEEAYPTDLAQNRYLDYLLEELIEVLRFPSKEDAFFKAFSQMFTIHLTTESGWLEITDYVPFSHIIDQELEPDILKIQFRLPPEDDSIVSYTPEVHGGNYDTEMPLVRFLINPGSYLCPYDLLKNIEVKGIEISVDVEGVREVLLYNNLGQLDSNAPFNPFGPIPIIGSYWIVGSPEIARKQITRFDVHVEWAGLPTELGGFEEYYQAYESPFSESLYEASITFLSDGKWLPSEEHLQPRVRLFEPLDADRRSTGSYGTRAAQLSSGDDVASFLKPSQIFSEDDEFVYNSRSKNGFVRLTLANPVQAFGHKEYPQQLTRVLTENARMKDPESFRPIPNPPYTPLINATSFDYQAVTTIDLERAKSSDGSRFGEKVFHIHPFGLEGISSASSRNISLVPQYDSSGNLFVGLSARELSGILTLFFHLREDCAPEAGLVPTQATWSYLSSNKWEPLENDQIISDTTNGFLSSGIVTLNLPEEINNGNTVMPANLFWLKVSVDEHPEYLCSIYGIYTQALKVTWRHAENAALPLRRDLPAGTIKEPRVSIPHIDRIDQIVDSFGGSPPESPDRVKTRLSERLRHKNRALVPWDYERLVLEQFPDIFMAKCFSNMIAEPESPIRRGNTLVVVIPEQKEKLLTHLKPIVNGLSLREITEYLEGISSPFAKIAVRNPSYEEIQVRCTVKFSGGAMGGYYINALNQAISDYLSPWNTAEGYGAQFGWRIRRNDVETFIRNLGYVESVTNFSMLHIAEDDKRYSHLMDTVRGRTELDEISPLFPWSIAIPVRRHAIETTDSTRSIQPERTGISELRIGSTLIITEKNNNGS